MKRKALLLDPDLLSREVERLRGIITKKDERIKKLKSGKEICDLYDALDKKRKMDRNIYLHIESMKKEIFLGEEKYRRLEAVHKKLQEKFEVNFGFHEHLINVLGQATGLMEKCDAVRKQG